MNEGDALEILSRWLCHEDVAERIAAQVKVRTQPSAYGARTKVEIDHQLACPLDLHEGWRVTTKRTYLPSAHFSSQARHYLKTAEDERGRTIYCHELGAAQVVAALSYHIDDRPTIPVLLTAIGLRIDTDENAYLAQRTLVGALVLKQYVHAIADQIDRGGYVDLDLSNRQEEPVVRRLGFRPAPRLKGFRPGGLHLRQPAPRSEG